MKNVINLLEASIHARNIYITEQHNSAFRLFNGFTEGYPDLSLDIYGKTLLIHNYSKSPEDNQTSSIQSWVLEKFPWIDNIILKLRNGNSASEKKGILLFGQSPDRQICENGIWYAINLTINRDASFYLDTRNLRTWAKNNLTGKTVLNTFAYTGSLGVAALAGGAMRVIHMDRNNVFLNMAKHSNLLNNLPISSTDFLAEDFFPAVSRFKKSGQLFDCIFLDPPFFSSTSQGTVDLENNAIRLINKIRPLITDEGWLVTINNALFLSGEDYWNSLVLLCQDSYLTIEQIISVPQDICGYSTVPFGNYPADPAPFNHPTKITILKIRRKKTT